MKLALRVMDLVYSCITDSRILPDMYIEKAELCQCWIDVRIVLPPSLLLEVVYFGVIKGMENTPASPEFLRAL